MGLLAKRGNNDDKPAQGTRSGGLGNRPADNTPDRYKMREKLISFGNDFWVETMRNRRAYFVDGKALNLRNTLDFQDVRGQTLYRIQARALAVADVMAIEDPRGRQVASVRKAIVSVRDRLNANLAGAPDISIMGNFLSHEYTMDQGGKRVATVSKRWLTLADTYVVEIDQSVDNCLILALTVVVDQLTSS
jgi:uncharacterized protein YxjI